MDSELPSLRTCYGRMLFGGLLNSLLSIKSFTSKAKTIVFTIVSFNQFFSPFEQAYQLFSLTLC